VYAFLVTLGTLSVFLVIASMRQWRAYRRLAGSREGQGFPDFATSFVGSDVPEDVQLKVFECAQNGGGLLHFESQFARRINCASTSKMMATWETQFINSREIAEKRHRC
jgi:hypothetical protein